MGYKSIMDNEINAILTAIRSIKSFGWGQVRIVIQNGRVITVDKTFTDKIGETGGTTEGTQGSSPCVTRQG